MNRLCTALAITATAFLCGCVSVKLSDGESSKVRTQSSSSKLVSQHVSAIEPVITERKDGTNAVEFYLVGQFDYETTASVEDERVRQCHVALGCFPGVRACRGEMRDCLPNAAAAFWYNLIFAGLPTVHGLLLEPFNPFVFEQSDTLADRHAFVRAPLFGVAKYYKANTITKTVVTRSTKQRIRLDNAILKAPELGLSSTENATLAVPAERFKDNAAVRISFFVPKGHPLENELSDFSGISLTVRKHRK